MDPQPDPQPDRTADELMLELRARNASFPLGPVRLEALIEFLLPDGSPERLQFELLFRTHHVAVLEQGVAAARRAVFTDAVRGNGNGQIPKMR